VRERARFLCIIIIILHHKRIIIYDQCFCAYIVKCNPTFDKYMYVYLYVKLRLIIIIIIKLATKSLKRVHPSCFYFSKIFPTLFIENVLMLIKRKFFLKNMYRNFPISRVNLFFFFSLFFIVIHTQIYVRKLFHFFKFFVLNRLR